MLHFIIGCIVLKISPRKNPTARPRRGGRTTDALSSMSGLQTANRGSGTGE